MLQASQRTFSEAQIAVIMKAVLLAMEYLHAQHHIHRDIKGANILVTKGGACKLGEFGGHAHAQRGRRWRTCRLTAAD